MNNFTSVSGGLSPLGSSGLTSAPWPETQGDVQSHQTDQQDFGTDFPTGEISAFKSITDMLCDFLLKL